MYEQPAPRRSSNWNWQALQSQVKPLSLRAPAPLPSEITEDGNGGVRFTRTGGEGAGNGEKCFTPKYHRSPYL